MPDADLQAAITLFHRRYSVPVVAVLARDGPLGFTALVRRTGASRETLAATVPDLLASGLLTTVGTATRKVYALTPAGERLGAPCLEAVAVVPRLGLLEVALKKWPMLVVVALGRGAVRFGDLRSSLAGITSRALTDALKDLLIAGLVARKVENGFPPSTRYALSEAGRALFPVMDALVRAAGGAP